MSTGSKRINTESNKSTQKNALDDQNQTIITPFTIKIRNPAIASENAKDKLRNRLFEISHFPKMPSISIKDKKDHGIIPIRVIQGKDFYVSRINELSINQNAINSMSTNQPLNLNKVPNIIDASFSRKPRIVEKLPPLRDRKSESPFVKKKLETTYNKGDKFFLDLFHENNEITNSGLNENDVAERSKELVVKTERSKITTRSKEINIKNIINPTTPIQQSFNDTFSHNIIGKLTGRNLPTARTYENSGRIMRSTSVKQRKFLINEDSKIIQTIYTNEENDMINGSKSFRREVKFLPDQDTMNNDDIMLKLKDIDSFIYLMKEGRINPAEFIYLVKGSSGDLYNLNIVEFSEITDKQYFTLSEKGVSKFENNMPVEFVSLKDWLKEREQYNSIKQLSFFKKFRRWRTLKKWIKILRAKKKDAVSAKLMDKLFYANPILQSLLLKHKEFCSTIEKMRFVDSQLNFDIQTLDLFSSAQKRKRTSAIEDLKKFSRDLHENSRAGIRKILENLRNHIMSETSNQNEDKPKSNDENEKDLKDNTDIMGKGAASKNVFETLGFPEFLNYGHRSLLRNECSRFLRLAYLLDFITIEALGNMYILSAKDLLNRLTHVYNMHDNDINLGVSLKKQVPEPIFLVKIEFNPIEITEENIRYEEIGEDLENIEDYDLNIYAEFHQVSMYNKLNLLIYL